MPKGSGIGDRKALRILFVNTFALGQAKHAKINLRSLEIINLFVDSLLSLLIIDDLRHGRPVIATVLSRRSSLHKFVRGRNTKFWWRNLVTVPLKLHLSLLNCLSGSPRM